MSNFSDFVGGGGAKVWVSGTTYPVGTIVTSPAANYQAYVRVVAGAGTTDPASDATNWKPIGGRAVKSMQRGTATITSNGTTTTATVSSVDTTKSVLRYLGNSVSANDSAIQACVGFITLTNATTITFTRQNPLNSFQDLVVSWELAEYF